jgi:hypothetical protein
MKLPAEIRTPVAIGVAIVVLIFVLAIFTMINKPSARNEAKVAGSVGKQLDRVAAETPAIRQEQEDKQRAVDEIEGADQRLPDGFSAELERVRRGRERKDS